MLTEIRYVQVCVTLSPKAYRSLHRYSARSFLRPERHVVPGLTRLTKRYEEHGRHEIFGGGKKVALKSEAHSMVLPEEIITADVPLQAILPAPKSAVERVEEREEVGSFGD